MLNRGCFYVVKRKGRVSDNYKHEVEAVPRADTLVFTTHVLFTRALDSDGCSGGGDGAGEE